MPSNMNDALEPKAAKALKAKATRYNERGATLMEDPFAYEMPKKKKK